MLAAQPRSSLSVQTIFSRSGIGGSIERFNGKLRDELLNGEVFTTLREARR